VCPTRKDYDRPCRSIAEVLSKAQLHSMKEWIDKHYADTRKAALEQLHELFNDCQLCALNPVFCNEDTKPSMGN